MKSTPVHQIFRDRIPKIMKNPPNKADQRISAVGHRSAPIWIDWASSSMIWLRSPCVPNCSASFPPDFGSLRSERLFSSAPVALRRPTALRASGCAATLPPLRKTDALRSVYRNRSGNWLRKSPHTPIWPNHSRSGQIDPDRSSALPNSRDSYILDSEQNVDL